jgi:hypothetical protein
MNRLSRQTLAMVVIALVVAAVAGGFAIWRGGTSTATVQSAPAAQRGAGTGGRGPASSAAFEQFRQCMENNGVTASPGQRPDPNDPTVEKARQACAQYAPQFPGRGGGAPPANSGTAA